MCLLTDCSKSYVPFSDFAISYKCVLRESAILGINVCPVCKLIASTTHVLLV